MGNPYPNSESANSLVDFIQLANRISEEELRNRSLLYIVNTRLLHSVEMSSAPSENSSGIIKLNVGGW